MRDTEKDYYEILGVLASADEAVVKAVYRALAKKFHPDIYKGPKADAERRMKEINEAYETLADPAMRARYDAERKPRQEQSQRTYGDDGDDEGSDEAFSAEMRQEWNLSVRYYPAVEEMRASLLKYSGALALTFQVKLLRERVFSDAANVARDLKAQFLRTYFGTNPIIREFATSLLEKGLKPAAKELNRLIRASGSPSDADARRIVQLIRDRYEPVRPPDTREQDRQPKPSRGDARQSPTPAALITGAAVVLVVAVAMINQGRNVNNAGTAQTPSAVAPGSDVHDGTPRDLLAPANFLSADPAQSMFLTMAGLPAYQLLLRRVAVGADISRDGSVVFGSGCDQTGCENGSAAFAVDQSSNKAFAVIAPVNDQTPFKIYGGVAAELPLPLRMWLRAATERVLNVHVVDIAPVYVLANLLQGIHSTREAAPDVILNSQQLAKDFSASHNLSLDGPITVAATASAANDIGLQPPDSSDLVLAGVQLIDQASDIVVVAPAMMLTIPGGRTVVAEGKDSSESVASIAKRVDAYVEVNGEVAVGISWFSQRSPEKGGGLVRFTRVK